VQRPESRFQTALWIAAGTCRDGLSLGFVDLGDDVSANFCLRACLSKTEIALARIFPTSPSGI